MTDALLSKRHGDVARKLTNMLIQTIREDESLGGAQLAHDLETLRNIDANSSFIDERAAEEERLKREKMYAEILNRYETAQERSQLLEAYAKMGHLNELSGLVARDNTFKLMPDGKPPSGIEDFLADQPDLQTALEKLNSPIFEATLTAHPTNVNSPEAIMQLRTLGKTIDAYRNGNAEIDSVSDAIADFAHLSLLTQKDGKDVNLDVAGETKLVTHYLNNIYEDVVAVYDRLDNGLSQMGDYNPLDLDLQIKLSSWGSAGDKDGNKKVTAESTLEAIAMHKMAIITRFAEDVQAIDAEALEGWTQRFDSWKEQLQPILTELEQRREAKKVMQESGQASDEVMHNTFTPADFDRISAALSTIATQADDQAFKQATRDAYEQTEGEERSKALLLNRRARLFNLNFAKIEYRETAEEYSRVVDALVSENVVQKRLGLAFPTKYSELPEEQRSALLTDILVNEPALARALYQARKEEIDAAAGKAYSTDDVMPIAYHTMRRMELARDHEGMVGDNVLAECQHTSNLLEMQFLQQAAADEAGKRPKLGVIPLFEDPTSIRDCGNIMAGAYENQAYKQHLDMLAQVRHGGEITQQVQIAHSDNTRRAGLSAARAFIHDAHDLIRDAGRKHGVRTQFFEGGSHSDAYRGGVRAISAVVKDYKIADHAKFTFQGGDNLNIFNYAPSIERMFTRAVVTGARYYDDAVQARTNSTQETPLDRLTKAVLKDTFDDYRKEVFSEPKIGRHLALLGSGNQRESMAASAGSRGERNAPKASQKRSSTVDPEKVRTITFSELLQHGGVSPTWLGSRTIEMNLSRNIREIAAELEKKIYLSGNDALNGDEKELFQLITQNGKKRLSEMHHLDYVPAEILHTLYKQSRPFKDVMDRIAFGVASSSIPAVLANADLRNDDYTAQVRHEYRQAARIASAAIEGAFPRMQDAATEEMRQHVLNAIPHLREQIEAKTRYQEFLLMAKATYKEEIELANRPDQAGGHQHLPAGEELAHIDRLIHAGMDTVTHGRYLQADDPAYGMYVASQQAHTRHSRMATVATAR